MSGNRSNWSIRTGLADRTAATDFCIAAIPFDPGVLVCAAQLQFMTFDAGVTVAFAVILEVAEVVFALGLMLAVKNRNVRRHLAVQQPRQKWPRAIRSVGGEPIWLEMRSSMALVATISCESFAGVASTSTMMPWSVSIK